MHLLTAEKKMLAAQEASQWISELGKGNMFNYPPEVLFAFMEHGMAVFALADDGTLGGFIKIDPWVTYPNGEPEDDGIHGSIATLNHIADGQAVIQGFESGSLIVPPKHQEQDLATELKTLMAADAVESFPGKAIFSVVTNKNKPSIAVNYKCGWIPVPLELEESTIGIDFINVPDWDASIPVTVFVYPPSVPNMKL